MNTQVNFDCIHPSTKGVTPELIPAVTEHIVQHMTPNQIILFGSWAKGTASDDSDLDLMVVLDDHHQLALLPPRKRVRQVSELFRYRRFGLDTMIFTQGELQFIQERNEGEWELVLDILNEGLKLYDKSTQN